MSGVGWKVKGVVGRAKDVGFRIWDSGFMVQVGCLGFGGSGSVFWVSGLGFGVQCD